METLISLVVGWPYTLTLQLMFEVYKLKQI